MDWRPLIGVVIGALLGFGGTELRGYMDRRRKRWALADLLWHDLVSNRLLLARAKRTVDLELDPSLWKGLRLDVVQAGFDPIAFGLVHTAYAAMQLWNDRLKEVQFSESPHNPSKERVLVMLDTAISKVRPHVSKFLAEIDHTADD